MAEQGMIDRLTEGGRWSCIEMNATKKLKQSKSQGNQPKTYYDRSKTTGRCGIVHLRE
jgi:hypothetical protein